MNTIVSVIIPIFNEEKQICRCSESIISQTYRNLEIILVDDGSTDKCPEICDDYARKDSRIKVIHKPNGGLSDAKNVGLNIITGEYVYFLDAKDFVEPTLIEMALGNAVATSADLVVFHYNKVDEFDNLLSPVRFRAAIYDLEDHNRLEYIMNELQQYRSGWEIGNRLFKTEIIVNNHLSFWDNRLDHIAELGFSLSYSFHVNKISFLPEVLFYYQIQKGSDRAQPPTEPMVQEAIELCKLMKDKIASSFKNTKIEKEYPILLFSLINEQLTKLNYNNYKDALSSVEDKKFFYRQIRRVITKPLRLMKYYGIIKGIALLLQCIFISSGRTEKAGIFIIQMLNKFRKISETFQYNKTKLGSKRRIFLIGCEDFWNLGDHHIAISEIEYLEKTFPDDAIIEITASRYFAVNRLLPFVIRRKDLICMHGGGNIGNFYMLAEYIRRDLMKKFRKNEKVIFPQTIHYDNSEDARAVLEEDQRRIRKTEKLTLCTREKYSYELAKKYFDCNVILTPDIVLFSDYTDKFTFDRRGAIILLRNDLEGVISMQDKQFIEKVVRQYTTDIKFNDTQLITDITVFDRKEVIEAFIGKLAKAEFVITDRLHGMVFCAITKTPCIVLPNYNHKVEGVYEWISNLAYIIMIKTMNELEEAMKKLRKTDGVVYDKSLRAEGFGALTELLKSKVK